MIIAIQDRWAWEDENKETILQYIEVPDEKGQEILAFIFDYEKNAEDGEYNLEDMLWKLEEKFDVKTGLETKLQEVLF